MSNDDCVACDGVGTIDLNLHGVVVLETCGACQGLGKNAE